VKANSCFVPATLDGGLGNAKHVRRFLLAQALVEQQVDDLLQIFREALHLAVKVLPVRKIFGLISTAVERSTGLVGSLLVGVVVSPLTASPEVVPLEIKKFPTDLGASEVKEVADRLNLHCIQGSAETNEALLKDVVGRLPSPERRVVPEHPAGEP